VIDLTVATWNVEWRAPGSVDAALIRERLNSVGADIICLTEAYADFMGGEGHLIESEPDYGYPVVQGRRKVLLWSREPWAAVDRVGQPDLPPGRFVAGRTMTPVGPINVVGVCIPWREAHVRSGTRDRTLWQDHLAYLKGLRGILADRTERTLVMGDFNQRVPGNTPRRLCSQHWSRHCEASAWRPPVPSHRPARPRSIMSRIRAISNRLTSAAFPIAPPTDARSAIILAWRCGSVRHRAVPTGGAQSRARRVRCPRIGSPHPDLEQGEPE
jgi:endonuclease/exonuclease/phosphatase family metal-dependent hydrolase